MPREYSEASPLTISEANDIADISEVFAWTARTSAQGGITIKIGCQTWPIEHWKTNLRDIIEEHLGFTDDNGPMIEDSDLYVINDWIPQNKQKAIEAATMLIEQKCKKDDKLMDEYEKKMLATIAYVEQMVLPRAPSRAPRAPARVRARR